MGEPGYYFQRMTLTVDRVGVPVLAHGVEALVACAVTSAERHLGTGTAHGHEGNGLALTTTMTMT